MSFHLAMFGLLLALPASAAVTLSETHTFRTSMVIPDNNLIGVADSRQAVSAITTITGVSLFLETNGGWNGDLYAYLSHGSGFAILLNRPGRTAGNPDGSASSGFRIIFDDQAPDDIHLAIPGSGLASGTFQADGRDVLPSDSYDSTPRSASLSSFQGMDANGEWTLFVADASLGSVATLTGWTLVVTGVPEPSALMLLLLGSLTCWRRTRACAALEVM